MKAEGRTLQDMGRDVLRREMEAMGAKLLFLGAQVGGDARKEDLFAIDSELERITRGIKELRTDVLTDLIDKAEPLDDIPF